MERAEIMTIAETIREQLVGTTNRNVLYSWGTQGFAATLYRNMATLQFKVNGRIFQGHVLISYNPSDYYEIYLLNNKGEICISDMAYFDQLGEIIDTAVESGTDADEYNKFCKKERDKLFCGQF